MSDSITGYVIKSRSSHYLSRDFIWYHGEPEQAYVFTVSQFKAILELCYNWKFKPDSLIPAVYENGWVNITGSEISSLISINTFDRVYPRSFLCQ